MFFNVYLAPKLIAQGRTKISKEPSLIIIRSHLCNIKTDFKDRNTKYKLNKYI